MHPIQSFHIFIIVLYFYISAILLYNNKDDLLKIVRWYLDDRDLNNTIDLEEASSMGPITRALILFDDISPRIVQFSFEEPFI